MPIVSSTDPVAIEFYREWLDSHYLHMSHALTFDDCHTCDWEQATGNFTVLKDTEYFAYLKSGHVS
jgi:hypothetical protein